MRIPLRMTNALHDSHGAVCHGRSVLLAPEGHPWHCDSATTWHSSSQSHPRLSLHGTALEFYTHVFKFISPTYTYIQTLFFFLGCQRTGKSASCFNNRISDIIATVSKTTVKLQRLFLTLCGFIPQEGGRSRPYGRHPSGGATLMPRILTNFHPI